VCMRMSCVNGCVVALDWYLSGTFFRSGVSGEGVFLEVKSGNIEANLDELVQTWGGGTKLIS